MKIVYIVTRSDSIGGAHVHVRDLAVALRAAGHEIIVASGQMGPFGGMLAEQGIPHYPLRHLVRAPLPWKDVAALLEIRALLRALRPDLVSTHCAKAGWLGRAAARSLRIPVVSTAHGWSFTTGVPAVAARLYRWGESLTAPFADRIITVSDYDRELAIQYRVAAPEKLVTVHNGMPDLAPGLRADPAATPVRFVMVARFEPQKDHVTLLRALAGLRAVPWEVTLIGDGPLRPHAAALAEELGIADRVRFLGARRDVAEQMAGHQVFLLITNWEGFPRSILEAMRAGLPVVASAVGGVCEALVDGKTGLVVPRGDVATLRARLALLLDNPSLRARMGAAGRRRYESRFTLGHMLKQTLAIYGELTGRPVETTELPLPRAAGGARRAVAFGAPIQAPIP